MIKGVIFDFNGTLFWDTHLHNQAWDLFLQTHHICLTKEEQAEKIHGKHNPAILSGLFEHKLLQEEIRTFSIEKENIYQELCSRSGLQLANGVIDFFEFLSGKNIPYTIATGSDEYNVDYYFELLNLEKYFDRSAVVCNDGRIRSKPDPQMFLIASQKLHLLPSEILIFEDSEAGIKAAIASGAGKIIIVDSIGTDLRKWNLQVITSFDEVDRGIFKSGSST